MMTSSGTRTFIHAREGLGGPRLRGGGVDVENARPRNEKLYTYALLFFLYLYFITTPPFCLARRSADAAANHKYYYQTLYTERRSLIGPWSRTLILVFVSKYWLWSESLLIFSCWLTLTPIRRPLNFMLELLWHYLISSDFSGRRKTVCINKQV